MKNFSISEKIAKLIEYHGSCKFVFSEYPNRENDVYLEFYFEDIAYEAKFDPLTNTIKRLDEK